MEKNWGDTPSATLMLFPFKISNIDVHVLVCYIEISTNRGLLFCREKTKSTNHEKFTLWGWPKGASSQTM